VSPIARRNVRGPTGLPSYLASLYDVPLLTARQEVYLFRKYNFLKFRAAGLRSQLDQQRKQNKVLDQIEQLYEEAVATKNQIIQANLRLVVSIVKRYVSDTEQLFDLVSEGNESLMRAVEKFDYTRGFKFSTYATWAIKKNYARSFAKEMKQRDRFRSGSEELFDGQPEHRADPHAQLRAQEVRENQVGKILDCLPDRERQIIVERFGLTADAGPKTLQVIANELGVSKERVRQLERRAMSKLREAAREENVELSEAA
jgi:RNA polymerase primary sigma factor/RNA polymerase sigma factor